MPYIQLVTVSKKDALLSADKHSDLSRYTSKSILKADKIEVGDIFIQDFIFYRSNSWKAVTRSYTWLKWVAED